MYAYPISEMKVAMVNDWRLSVPSATAPRRRAVFALKDRDNARKNLAAVLPDKTS